MFHSLQALCLVSLSIGPALGHMEMTWPYALRSKFNPKNDWTNIDYSNTSPLLADGSNYPCKGYQNDRPFKSVAEFVAGSDHNLTLSGSATHNGGSCQISMSYDNGATFRVIKSIIGGCPLVNSYDFTVPSTAPSGNALLAWSWQNLNGNREFYMNCAQINVVATTGRRRRRQAANNFDNLPLIWKANIPGVNQCATVEGKDVVYPNPGPSISWGNGLSESSPPTAGTCDAAKPYGKTYKDLGDTPAPGGNDATSAAPPTVQPSVPTTSTTPPPTTRTTPPPTSSTTPPSSSRTTPAPTTPAPTTPTPSANVEPSPSAIVDVEPSMPPGSDASSYDSAQYALSFITVATVASPSITTSILKAGRTRRSSSRSTHVPRSAAMGDYEQVKLAAMTSPSQPSQPSQSTLTVTITEDCETTTSATQPTHAPEPSSSRPPYATGNTNGDDGYLPCVPGTFLCTSRSTWQTCNYNDGSVQSSMEWVWGYERTVAAGMECLPFLSPYTDQTSSQQNSSPGGSYRDDRYIRARPDGDCDTDGSIRCTYEGSQFDMCDQGKLIVVCHF